AWGWWTRNPPGVEECARIHIRELYAPPAQRVNCKRGASRSPRVATRGLRLAPRPIWNFPPLFLHFTQLSRTTVHPPGQRGNGPRVTAMPPKYCLPFEKEIYAMEELLAQLEAGAGGQLGGGEEVRRLRRELTNLIRKIYSDLQPWQTVLVSRHPERPQLLDYLDLIFDEFVELHGDRAIGDDRAIRTGFARLGDFRILLLGHQKGRDLKERTECFYGCAHPEGYR